MLHIVAFNVSLLVCLIFSVTCGGRPEKAGMLSLTAAAMLTISAINFLPRTAGFSTLAEALAVIDGALFIGLTFLALRANRLWPIILAGLQLTTIAAHISKAIYPALPAASYGIFAQFWAWPMIATVACGTLQHRRRVRKFGAERDWKPLWPHSALAASTS